MTRIESPEIHISKPAGEVFAFLSALMNHKEIMPAQVKDFTGDADTCSYTIENTGSLQLKVEERIANEKIKIVPNGKVPFVFDLTWQITPVSDSQCRVRAVIQAELNMMLRMLAEKPLTNFITLQAENLQKKFTA